MKPKKPNPGESLAEINPKLAAQWHPINNGNLTPFDVTSGSSKKIWWKCDKGDDHEWKVSVSNRKNGWGCPICSGRKVVKSTSLAALNPALAKEWHPTKNGNLTAFNVSPNSQKKAWWKCPKGDDHEWNAIVADRNNGIGCAICSNYKVVKSNSLETLNPELAKEWHTIKNGELTPRDVHPGSAKRVWWKCLKGDDHEWKAVVYSRTGGKGCPICDGKKVVKSTCLATLNPILSEEWHPTKNGKITADDVGINSGKRIWWKCAKGDDHEWRATVHQRTLGMGCPICANQKIVLSNCLATLNPELAKEWHPLKNNNLTPFHVGVGSGKVVWWKCPEGDDHEWRAAITKRNKGRGCPICIGRKVIKSNSLGALNPELASQWHPIKNYDFTPYQIRPGSNKKVWWICTRNNEHEWIASVSDRNNGTGCPKCNPSTSAPELRIYCELKAIFPSTQNRYIFNGFEVDIFIPELNFGIEYDGWYWHKGKVEKDLEKNTALKDSIFLLRVREKGLKKLSNIDISLETERISIDVIHSILRRIINECPIKSNSVWEKANNYLKRSDWLASDHFDELQINRNNVVFERSITYLNPKLAEQWHPVKNGALLPEHFTPGSHRKVWWQNSIGHEWKAVINQRVRKELNRLNPDQYKLFDQKD